MATLLEIPGKGPSFPEPPAPFEEARLLLRKLPASLRVSISLGPDGKILERLPLEGPLSSPGFLRRKAGEIEHEASRILTFAHMAGCDAPNVTPLGEHSAVIPCDQFLFSQYHLAPSSPTGKASTIVEYFEAASRCETIWMGEIAVKHPASGSHQMGALRALYFVNNEGYTSHEGITMRPMAAQGDATAAEVIHMLSGFLNRPYLWSPNVGIDSIK